MQLEVIDRIVTSVFNLFNMSDNKKKGIYLSYEGIKGLALASILAYQFIINSSVREVPSTMKALEEHSAELRSLREDIKSINEVLRRAKLTSNTTGKQISTAVYN